MHTPSHQPQLDQMRQAMDGWVSFSDAQWAQLSALFEPRTYAENEHVLLPGDFVHEVVFVNKGLLRLYYLSEDGVETNKAFVAENQCAKPLAASLMNLPVYYGTQALEPTQVLVADFVALYDEDPIFDRLGRRIAETILIGKEMRARTLLQQKARERYLTFVEQFPDLVDRVPQYHIASYLGITEVSLSRIKRGLRQTEPESVLSLAV